MMKSYSEEKIEQIVEELKKKPGLKEKYDCAGIYSISIDGILVYIGKSINMLKRLAQHLDAIEHPHNHKYKVLREAYLTGHSIDFDVLYFAVEQKENKLLEEIGAKEGELIRLYRPPLNYQIPKEKDYHSYRVNRSAKTIKLSAILGQYSFID